MQAEKEYTIAVVYSDDGPKGPCGQSCSTTMPWTKVWLFKNEEDARQFCKNHQFPDRKKSRVDVCNLKPFGNNNTLSYL